MFSWLCFFKNNLLSFTVHISMSGKVLSVKAKQGISDNTI